MYMYKGADGAANNSRGTLELLAGQLRGRFSGLLSPGPTVGFATSIDGRRWKHFPDNPVIAPGKPWTNKANEYRPAFIGYLGRNAADQRKYLVAWSEHPEPHVIYSTTTDFKSFKRDPRGYAKWKGPDGLVSPWREGNRLYLFAGKHLHEIALPVAP